MKPGRENELSGENDYFSLALAGRDTSYFLLRKLFMDDTFRNGTYSYSSMDDTFRNGTYSYSSTARRCSPQDFGESADALWRILWRRPKEDVGAAGRTRQGKLVGERLLREN